MKPVVGWKILYTLVWLCLLLPASVQSQITMTLNVSPNPSPYVSDWTNRKENASITVVVGAGNKAQQAKFKAELYRDEALIARTKFASMPVVTLPAGPGAQTWFGESIFPYSAVEFVGRVDADVIKTGMLPSGSYKLCLELVSIDGRLSLAANAPVCAQFMLTDYELPTLLSPENNAELKPADRPTFRWTPLSPAPRFAVKYRFMLFEVLDGMKAPQAMKQRPIYEKDVVQQTQLPWPSDFTLPSRVKQCVWTVRTLDDMGNPIGARKGVSEPFLMHVGASKTLATRSVPKILLLLQYTSTILSDPSLTIDDPDPVASPGGILLDARQIRLHRRTAAAATSSAPTLRFSWEYFSMTGAGGSAQLYRVAGASGQDDPLALYAADPIVGESDNRSLNKPAVVQSLSAADPIVGESDNYSGKKVPQVRPQGKHPTDTALYAADPIIGESDNYAPNPIQGGADKFARNKAPQVKSQDKHPTDTTLYAADPIIGESDNYTPDPIQGESDNYSRKKTAQVKPQGKHPTDTALYAADPIIGESDNYAPDPIQGESDNYSRKKTAQVKSQDKHPTDTTLYAADPIIGESDNRSAEGTSRVQVFSASRQMLDDVFNAGQAGGYAGMAWVVTLVETRGPIATQEEMHAKIHDGPVALRIENIHGTGIAFRDRADRPKLKSGTWYVARAEAVKQGLQTDCVNFLYMP